MRSRGRGWSARVLAIVVAALCAGCTVAPLPAPPTPAPVYLRLGGSTAMLPALQDLATLYAERHPGVQVELREGAEATGLDLVQAGLMDVALVSRQPAAAGAPGDTQDGKGTQVDKIEADGQVEWHPFARVPLVLIVHPRNTLPELSLIRTRELFAGWYSDWSQLGGPSEAVQVLSRESSSGSRRAWDAGLMGNLSVTPGAMVIASSSAMVGWVAGHPNSVGYVSAAYITDTVRVVPVGGSDPTPAAVESGDYPLVESLYLITRPNAEGPARDFLALCGSDEGQAIIRKYNGVPG